VVERNRERLRGIERDRDRYLDRDREGQRERQREKVREIGYIEYFLSLTLQISQNDEAKAEMFGLCAKVTKFFCAGRSVNAQVRSERLLVRVLEPLKAVRNRFAVQGRVDETAVWFFLQKKEDFILIKK